MTFVAVLATYFRHLILRHREYNGDISLVPKIDLQGRSDDPTEAPKLGSFSFVIDSSIISKIWYFVECLLNLAIQPGLFMMRFSAKITFTSLTTRILKPFWNREKAYLKHSPVLLFRDYYWNPECVTFNPPYETYCDFLNEEVDRVCDPWVITPECLTALDLRDSICGEPFIVPPTEDGSGEEGSGASGN